MCDEQAIPSRIIHGGSIDIDAEHPKSMPGQKDRIAACVASDIEHGAVMRDVLQDRNRNKVRDGWSVIDS